MGSYRLWRDGGYVVGGLGVGLLLGTAGTGRTLAIVGAVVVLASVVIARRLPETHSPARPLSCPEAR